MQAKNREYERPFADICRHADFHLSLNLYAYNIRIR